MSDKNPTISPDQFKRALAKMVSTGDKKLEEAFKNFNLDNIPGVYIMKDGDTEEDIPQDAFLVIYPDEDGEVIDWTNYYNKQEINEIIRRAEFKRGKSAYEVAVEGIENPPTLEEWLESLKGKSAYKIAVENGFEGEETEWLQTLIGKSAYEIACELGFRGSPEQWVASLKGEPFRFEDFTLEQLASLKGGKGDPFTYEDFTPEQLEGLKPKKGYDYFDGFTPTVTVEDVIVEDKKVAVKFKVTDINGETTSVIDIKELESRLSAYAQNYIDYLLAELVGTAPDSLNTLWELANALGNDPNFATTILNKIGNKVEKDGDKVLSTNDYTTADKNKLDELASKDLLTKEQIEAMISALESKIATEYLGGKKLRFANDDGVDNFVTFKKG